MLVGVLLRGPELRLEVAVDGAVPQRSNVALVDAAPASVVPVAVRLRSVDSHPLSIADPHKAEPAGLAFATLAGLGVLAMAWWRLVSQDYRLAPPLLRSSLAALRAPPAHRS